MAFYVTMSAFIAANLALIGFEARRSRARTDRAPAFAPVNRRSSRG